ncbi:alpha-(1,3)-fucosyltransferase 4 [Astyanax mexicanus]|uniref:alpha-(1,3)-fucosyltransferase 4 n=1 Tax=Astyanax mexicanus TaxID=7994 RepID=UPI0020CB175A|nr:alpha-(1,3)-fucosyltransferase 4 [Astyanax mexicanus]
MAIFSICVSNRVRLKRLRILALIVPAFLLLVLAVPHALAPATWLNSDIDSESDLDTHVTLLLLWWAPFGSTQKLPGSCTSYGVRGCVLTLDREEYGHADAVIMHHRDLVNEPDALPKPPRPEGQKWIWMNFESPSHSPWLEGLDGVFNLTMSYRLGSDIFLPYGYLQRRRHSNSVNPLNRQHGNGKHHQHAIDNHLLVNRNGNGNGDARNGVHSSVARHGNDFKSLVDHHSININYPVDEENVNDGNLSSNNGYPVPWRNIRSVRRRRTLVAWVISNWSEEQERVQFYWRLRRYIRVDIYGRRALSLINDSVFQTISGYKFYLAFENSIHTDYITEKLWRNALESGAVPVVLGPPRENYERFLPPDAFIHVHDFKSPRALAAYLLYLDRNPAQYRRYLAWRHDYTVHVTSFWAEHYCAACRAVQASRKQRKTIKHLGFWFQS